MKRALLCLCLAALGVLAACETPDTYPVSGEACAPDDPVKDLSAENCTPPV
ncbi:hypothetical protein [uncultured Tateyamaria sp.]|uniref:hypothetical protein n=1 Tax=Tateyamaria sp. 1078 TaxID=3417464 RepID=UPI00262591A3|nr:hypothetical protein [uncultured Tateyamaria sp.]